MERRDATIGRIAELLSRGETLVTATVIEVRGSAPREVGARLLLRADGRSEGTVGGGPLEARALQAARGLLDEGGPPRCLEISLDEQAAAEEGMVCGGWARILLERLG